MGKGGGNDGGVLVNGRAFMVKTAAPKEKRDTLEVRNSRWTTCAISGEPLADPVVADAAGHLFNRESVLTYLLEKRSVPAFAHLKRMRDVFALQPGTVRGGCRVFVCPVTQTEANAAHAFVALRTCGCVLSDAALKIVRGDGCPACGVRFDRVRDAVRLVPTDEELETARDRAGTARRDQAAAVPVQDSLPQNVATTATVSVSQARATGIKRSRESSDPVLAMPSSKSISHAQTGNASHHAAPHSTISMVRAIDATSAALAATATVENAKLISAVYSRLFEKRPDPLPPGGGRGVQRW